MSEDCRQILQMLAEGAINADEAERLLAALDVPAASGGAAPTARSGPPKYLRVVVDAANALNGDKPTRVNVRVPMQLLRAGMRLSALIPPAAREQVNQAMREQGVPFDLNQMRPENVEALIEQLNDLTVDVDQDKTKVRVFCE